jgi:ATP-dependent DNA ligase
MEARSEPRLPQGSGWWYEPKWDGFRCLAFKSHGRVELIAKSGKSLNRFFPEVVDRLASSSASCFGLDGELVAREGEGVSFERLQDRLHPAQSRIRRLAEETPATFILFDFLVGEDGKDLRSKPHTERRAFLENFLSRFGGSRLELTPGTSDPALAQSWLESGGLEGIVAKRSDGPYIEGERAMVKVKRLRSADCVVGGFRYARTGNQVGSLLLGLFDDDNRLNHVGFTSGFANVDRGELTQRLRSLEGGEGFTGRAPGGPSRWSTERSSQWTPVRPELVVEVGFDHASGDRFRHGVRLLRFRPDKAPEQCRMDQLQG